MAQRLEVLDELELGTGLWRVGEASALLDGTPFDGDSLEGVLAALRQAALHEPAPDHHASASNAWQESEASQQYERNKREECIERTSSAMDSADPAASLIILQHLENLVHGLPVPRYPSIDDRKPVVLHVRLVDTEFFSPGEEVGSVRAQLALLG